MRKAFADKQEQEQAMLQVLAYCTHPLAIIYVFLIIILQGPPGSIGPSDWLEISTHLCTDLAKNGARTESDRRCTHSC